MIPRRRADGFIILVQNLCAEITIHVSEHRPEKGPQVSHTRAVCYVSTEEFLSRMMPKCGCALEGAGAVDQMKIHAHSLVDITDGTFLSYTMMSGSP